MRGAVHLLQHADRDVRVNLRGGQAGVAEHLLDEADVRAAFQHQRRHGVTEQMTRSRLADLGVDHVHAHRGC